ncbi:AAA family ATPase [Kitasatospora indigofera]|uniref:AAA family ATPase n=1 Tax=Kitasatospora indigofera TaxID=67307 RepID=UPI00339F98C6
MTDFETDIWERYGPPPGEDEPAPGESTRRLVLTRARDIEPEPVIWAWEPELGEGRIPAGALTLAAGREGTGKSSFGIWLAAQLSRGTLPGTFQGRPRAVFYAAVEDSWSRTLVPRLMAAGADLDHVYRVEAADILRGETMISLPLDVELIEKAIAEYDVAALIVDPLMSTLGTGTDAHRTQDVRQALEPLVRMAERTKALTLGIAHFNKASGSDASQLISGSGAFKDLARAIIAFARDPENEQQVMTQTKNSLGRLGDLPSLGYRIEGTDIHTPKGVANVGRLEWTGIAERSVEDTLAAAADRGDVGERDEAVAWLRDYLTDNGGEAPVKDIKKAAQADDIAERTLERAKKKLGADTVRQGFGQGALWRMPATVSDAASPFPPQSRHSRQLSGPGGNGGNDGGNGPEPPEPSLTATEVSPLEMGPCARCGTSIHRYGDGAQTLCPNCRSDT